MIGTLNCKAAEMSQNGTLPRARAPARVRMLKTSKALSIILIIRIAVRRDDDDDDDE
jgi:hypothetical protein